LLKEQQMANIMIRRDAKGSYQFYLPKRDLEDTIVSMEFDTPEKWGGEIKLNNGGTYYIEPQAAPARLPYSVRARRLDAAE
jgi:nitrogen fixation protein NifT